MYVCVFWLCIQVRLSRFHYTRVSAHPCWKRSFQVIVFPRWSHQHSPEIQVGFMVTTLRQLLTLCDLVFPWWGGVEMVVSLSNYRAVLHSFLFGFMCLYRRCVEVLSVHASLVMYTYHACIMKCVCTWHHVDVFAFFSTLTRNIRHRRGEKVVINVPSKSNSSVFTLHHTYC